MTSRSPKGAAPLPTMVEPGEHGVSEPAGGSGV